MTEPAQDGFTRATFTFFEQLAEHNTREWFAEHRPTYEEQVRGPLEDALEVLADELGGRVKVFRQHRDVRFSKDKSPYKLTTYGVVTDRPGTEAAGYLQLSAEGLFAGTGYYELAADQLERLRAGIDDAKAGPALEAAVERVHAAGIETFGRTLKTAPRGYPRDHPRLALLQHKILIAGLRLPPGTIAFADAVEHARSTWAAIDPIVAWLDEHVGASHHPRAARR